jgi:putative nucleotidyltransferase with HDIG domain
VEQKQLEKFRAWFDDYVAGFYGDDDYVNANLKMKLQHTHRTRSEMQYLAQEIGLSDNQKQVAEVIALFHDVGRFEQFTTYGTYNDARSTNHCVLGLKVLDRAKVLENLDPTERQCIARAIEYHGRRELPKDLDGESLLFAKLIRDADKLDVFYTVTEYYRQYRDNGEQFMLELEFPDEPGYSAKVVEAVLQGRLIDYTQLRTLNDAKLVQLGWVYDVNFPATLKRIRQRRFLEKLLEFLPRTPDIEKVKDKIFEYVAARLSREGELL